MEELQAGLETFGNALIELTSFFILPNWNDVIQFMLPAAVVLGLLGPVVTLLVLYWLYQWLHMPRFRVRPPDASARSPSSSFSSPAPRRTASSTA